MGENLKAQIGVGLRPRHYPYLEENPETKIDWFECISENYIESEGRPRQILRNIRERYPVGLHGVSLNIGSYDKIDKVYLDKLKNLINEIDPFIVSDHLCWTGLPQDNLHNLLPLPYSKDVLSFLVEKIDSVQCYLSRQICIENLSAYLHWEESDYTEWDFLNLLAEKSGCKILLDINNVYVNSMNQGLDALAYLDAISNKNIGQFHLAGHTKMDGFLFDTHSSPVVDEVWKLFDYKVKTCEDVPILIEWDEDIPEFSKLEDEAMKAKRYWEKWHLKT